MKENTIPQIPVEDTKVSGVLIIEQFLSENYQFQKNVISNKLEVRARDGQDAPFQPLTAEVENSIIVRARKELEGVKSLKTLLVEQIHSAWDLNTSTARPATSTRSCLDRCY